MNARPIEFCYLGSHVQCRVFWQEGLFYLEYQDEGSWHLAFTMSGYQSMKQFLDYLTIDLFNAGLLSIDEFITLQLSEGI